MASSPIRCEGTSLSPLVSSWRWMPETSRSMRTDSMARLRQASWIERASLSRSKGSVAPPDFTTLMSRNWIRSNVVKRAPQPSHWRRRRIAAASSVGGCP